MRDILQEDPFNVSKQHHIKKLAGIATGDGEWRILGCTGFGTTCRCGRL
jgi:hypothetical protein